MTSTYVIMAKEAFEFTLILSGVQDLTDPVLDAFYAAGCDDALIGMRDGVVYADFCREAGSFREAAISAIRNVESAVPGVKVVHLEPDEMVTMSEIARRLNLSREGVRKQVAGTRGAGNFPTPVGGVTSRSPLWRWTYVVRWHQENQAAKKVEKTVEVFVDANVLSDLVKLGPHIAALNAVLDMRLHISIKDAMELLQSLGGADAAAGDRSTGSQKSFVGIKSESRPSGGARKHSGTRRHSPHTSETK